MPIKPIPGVTTGCYADRTARLCVCDYDHDRPAFVYLINGAGLVKIGHSLQVTQRLRLLRASCPVELTLLWLHPTRAQEQAHELEFRLHRVFTPQRHHDEWFDLGTPVEALGHVIAATQAIVCQHTAA